MENKPNSSGIWDRFLVITLWIPMGLIFLVMLMALADGLLRKAGFAIPGAYNYSEGVMVLVAFIGLGYITRKGQHVTVDILAQTFSRRGQALADIFTGLVTLALFIIALWSNLIAAVEATSSSELLAPFLPIFVPRIGLVLGLGILCAQLVIGLVGAFKHVFTPAASQPVSGARGH